jgi:hypothetical protein
VDIDVDGNEGGRCYIYQLGDDRFGLIVWVPKAQLADTRRAVIALSVGQEVVLGTIGCGERVWVTRHESGYAIGIGDTDSKDVWIRLSEQEVVELVEAEPEARA